MKLARREDGQGWIALIGGGEFSFEETESADAAWLGKTGEGEVAFLPTASGSVDYAKHFAVYLDEYFERGVRTAPVYRARDTRRKPTLDRLRNAAAVYIGGGVADRLLETVLDSPVAEALEGCLENGGVVVGIAAGAQALGARVRGLTGGRVLAGLGLLPHAIIDTNFDPGHDRRLRRLLETAGGDTVGFGIGAGSALLVGPDGTVEVLGEVHRLDRADAALERLAPTLDPSTLASPLRASSPEQARDDSV